MLAPAEMQVPQTKALVDLVSRLVNGPLIMFRIFG
jgi:hypothetical protein